MFYCDECREDRNYPETAFKSFGPCEICGAKAACSSVPSSRLPRKEAANETSQTKAPENHG